MQNDRVILYIPYLPGGPNHVIARSDLNFLKEVRPKLPEAMKKSREWSVSIPFPRGDIELNTDGYAVVSSTPIKITEG